MIPRGVEEQPMVTASPEQLREQAIAFFREDELPAGFRWFEGLSPLHQRLCSVELADALKRTIVTGELDGLQELIEGWEATAEIDACPEYREEVLRPKEYVPLSELTNESGRSDSSPSQDEGRHTRRTSSARPRPRGK
jgi:hypothetical protein